MIHSICLEVLKPKKNLNHNSMVFETETTVNMNSLVSLFVLNRVTFSTGDQELATFAAGEKGFSFGEEGMLISRPLLSYTYVTLATVDWVALTFVNLKVHNVQ